MLKDLMSEAQKKKEKKKEVIKPVEPLKNSADFVSAALESHCEMNVAHINHGARSRRARDCYRHKI